ncbi:MAG: ATP-binding cassette domain-containing protein [Acidimicrobiia bacterium]
MSAPVVEAEGLHKAYGEVRALDGLDLTVDAGSVHALLGPNGAGKTTMVRILSTLLRPDAGAARVGGHDVVADAHRVRSLIGLTGQFASVDDELTGFENLQLVGRLLGWRDPVANRRADELLDAFELRELADLRVKHYSGGLRRRLDLAAGLVGRPRVLFLDEPTAGLDLPSRIRLWSMLRGFVADGMTVLLTTQDLEEADEAADAVAVIDRGRVIAGGTTDELKAGLAQRTLHVTLEDPRDLEPAAAALAPLGAIVRDERAQRVSLTIGPDPESAARALGVLASAGIPLLEVALVRPSLSEVFLALTDASRAREASGR